jgi:hypothetical protein
MEKSRATEMFELDHQRLEVVGEGRQEVGGEEHRATVGLAHPGEALGGGVADDEEVAAGRDRAGEAGDHRRHTPRTVSRDGETVEIDDSTLLARRAG